MLAVFLAASSAAVAVPRPVDPVDVPEPTLAPRALAAAARADEALAAQAEAENRANAPLDLDVRALGSAIRAYGVADAAGVDVEVMQARARVAQAAQKASAQGEAALRKLRAYQLRAFLRALRQWEATHEESDDLRELGGGFLHLAERNGWADARGLAMDEAVRRAMFKKRWNELALTRGPGFDLSSDEQRALLRFLLIHAPHDEADLQSVRAGLKPARELSESERIAYARDKYRLRKIEEIAALDPSYPADLARGVVLFRMGHHGAAKEMFGRWLDAHPDGPFVVRAQNWLNAATVRATDAPVP